MDSPGKALVQDSVLRLRMWSLTFRVKNASKNCIAFTTMLHRDSGCLILRLESSASVGELRNFIDIKTCVI